mmetsp:Transcript_48356/g.80190  ORF Transcript_48356/g.80190 Transcript_48356/m.80190 type:complete len:101 (-) Transcript_48356:66-368(-)
MSCLTYLVSISSLRMCLHARALRPIHGRYSGRKRALNQRSAMRVQIAECTKPYDFARGRVEQCGCGREEQCGCVVHQSFAYGACDVRACARVDAVSVLLA